MIGGELEDADHVGKISWRSVGEDDDLQTAGQQGAMEDVLLQNILQHTQTHTHSLKYHFLPYIPYIHIYISS